MCYLCEASQTPRAQAVARAIDEALKVWRAKGRPYDDGENEYRHSWGFRHDWTRPPKPALRLPNVALGSETLGDGLWTEAELRERTP